MITRREFLGTSAALAVGAGPSFDSGCALAQDKQDAEPVIDIHQHTDYGGKRDKAGNIVDPGRTNEQLLAHQKAMGVARTVLLPAGREVRRPSTHGGSANGLQGTCGGNESCEKLAKAHPDHFVFGSNEVPDLPDAPEVIEKALKAGAVVI